MPGERPVFGTGLFRQQQVAVVAFALDAQALADDINGYSGEDEYAADNGGFPEDAVLHPVFGKGGLFLEILFLRYTGGYLHGGAGEGVREVDIAVYMVGRFPEVSGEGLYPVGCVLQFGQVEHVIVLRLCQLQVVARAVRTVFEKLDVYHGVCAVAGCLACRLFDA